VFSGIVEAIGTVVAAEATAAGRRLRVRAPEVVGDLAVGGSIAVDGACLTAVEVHPDGFSVDVIGTTLSRTVASTYREGSKVNLERALRLGDRLDGHLVQGHVDGVGEVVGVESDGDARLVDFTLPPEVDVVTVPHGSIAVNGVSLTVNALPAPGRCQVALIPHTRAVTTLDALRAGDRVNLEGDLIGKHVGRLHAARTLAPPSSSGTAL
jgi:riboflavin synthase